MSGPENGKYLIIPAGPSAPPPFPVGANIEGPTSPVVIGGKDHIWTANKLDNGNYTLILAQNGPRWLSKGHQDNVVVEIMPLPGEWTIVRHDGEFGGNYTIAVPTVNWPTPAWTVLGASPGTPVKLEPYNQTPTHGQLWRFIRLPE